MMHYFAIIKDGFILSYGTAEAVVETAITEERFNAIAEAVANKPQAEEGYAYMLRADNLEWELVQLPESEEPTEEESTPAWDISQGEYIPEGFLLTRDGVTYECIVGHYAAWNKQPPNAEYWKEVY